MLTFAKVTLGYNGRHVLEDINLVVNKGDFIGLVGPNGAGKSTLMKAMLGLVKPRAGSISWCPDIPKIGYVPQSEHIDPIWPMRVRDVLHLTLCSLERPHFFHKKEHSGVRQVMEMIAIESLANRTLDTLSGGELQRVLLARALIIEPDVLFLDEPTAAMDLVATRKFLSMISDLHRDHGITVVIVTHDLQSLAHRAEYLGKKSYLPTSGWIGVAYAAGSSIAVILVALSPSPDGTVLRFFTGDILGTTRLDAIYAFWAAIGTAIIFRLFWSRIVLTGFDPVMSRTLGIRVHLWNALLFLCLGSGLAVVMNTAGGMLAFSMLVGPPALAILLFRSFRAIVITAILTGVLAAFSGLTISFIHDLPGGPSMATAALVPIILVIPIKLIRTLKYRRP